MVGNSLVEGSVATLQRRNGSEKEGTAHVARHTTVHKHTVQCIQFSALRWVESLGPPLRTADIHYVIFILLLNVLQIALPVEFEAILPCNHFKPTPVFCFSPCLEKKFPLQPF